MKNTSLLRILCFCFAFLFLAGMLPLNALAATYYVSNGFELGQSWDMVANESSETSNTFVMTDNIDMAEGGWPLTTGANREYIITSEAGKNYTLNGASFWQQPSTGGGKVIIEADVTGSLSAVRDVEVIVEGDFIGNSGPDIYVAGGGSIQINGNMSDNADGIMVELIEDSTLSVNGNMENADSLYLNNSTVEVSGTLSADGDLLIEGEGNDSVTCDDLQVDDAMIYINEASVTVNGDVAGDSMFELMDADLTVKGNVETDGIYVRDSTVNVQGSVTSNDDLYLMGDGQITVSNDVIAKDDITISGDSKVTVKDQLKTDSTGSILVSDATLTQDNQIQTGTLTVEDNGIVSGVYINVGNAYIGIEDDYEDKSEVSSATIDCGNAGKVIGYGSSKTTVRQHIHAFAQANDNAAIRANGSIYHMSSTENGIVQSNLAGNEKVSYQGDSISELCKGYATGSQLDDQISNMHTLSSSLSGDISDRLGFGTGLLTSIFNHAEINKNKFLTTLYSDANNMAHYNKESVRNLQNADKINSHYVVMYKANLASIMEELENSVEVTVKPKNVQKVTGFLASFFKTASDIEVDSLPKEQQKALETAAKGGLTAEEAKSFLTTFGGYAEDADDLDDAAATMADMFSFCKSLGTTAKSISAILTVGEFVDYWITNYENQVKILDTYLHEQSMSPELFLAMGELRAEYQSKAFGLMSKTVSLGTDVLIAAVKSLAAPLSITEAVINLAGTITGVKGKTDALNNGAAMAVIAPEIYEALENSIKRVQDGDNSEEAIAAVESNFILYKGLLTNMCNVMIKAGNKEQKAEYEKLLLRLEDLRFGEYLILS